MDLLPVKTAQSEGVVFSFIRFFTHNCLDTWTSKQHGFWGLNDQMSLVNTSTYSQKVTVWRNILCHGITYFYFLLLFIGTEIQRKNFLCNVWYSDGCHVMLSEYTNNHTTPFLGFEWLGHPPPQCVAHYFRPWYHWSSCHLTVNWNRYQQQNVMAETHCCRSNGSNRQCNNPCYSFCSNTFCSASFHKELITLSFSVHLTSHLLMHTPGTIVLKPYSL